MKSHFRARFVFEFSRSFSIRIRSRRLETSSFSSPTLRRGPRRGGDGYLGCLSSCGDSWRHGERTGEDGLRGDDGLKGEVPLGGERAGEDGLRGEVALSGDWPLTGDETLAAGLVKLPAA